MRGLSLRSITLMLFVVFVICSLSFDTCIARRGRHWRLKRSAGVSLSKKKGNSQKNHNHYHKSKPKSPSHSKPTKPKYHSPIPQPPKPKYHSPIPQPPKPKYHSPIPQPPSAPLPTPFFSSPSPSPPQKGDGSGPKPPQKGKTVQESAIFNVIDFGAKGDGKTDDTKAFEAAWGAACKIEASTMTVPADYVFLVGPISFSGPYCQANILFQLDGTIIAPVDSKTWGKGLLWWIEFSKLRGITVQGKGVIDGRGSGWWQEYSLDDPVDDELKLIIPLNNTAQKRPPVPERSELDAKMPSIKPTALRFYGSFNATVTGITIQNSPQCHLKFDNCVGVLVYDMAISSPGDSPNTDGIHLQNSKDVLIHGTTLACGDDCISIQTGCSNVYVRNVDCGPGHGISIGSLGKDGSKACVSNITVRDVNMHNTMNGVRIKTWQGGSGSVQGVLFSNIQVSEVQLPIVIDQFYCDKSICMNQTSAVAVSGVTYEKIRGTYTVKPVHFACSDSLPCIGVQLAGIELKPVQERYHMYNPFCWQTFGELNTPTLPPIDCLQIGKPSRNGVHADHDVC